MISSNDDTRLFMGAMLLFPAVYFFTAAFFRYELNLPFMWKPIDAYFAKPENKSIGWNANLLIAAGPPAAVLLNLRGLVRIQVQRYRHAKWQLSLHLTFGNPRWGIIATGVLTSGVMIVYSFAENCR